MPAPLAPSPDQLVTSSDLVRHFGLWQERAARAPLYILHRGRPRFVMTSVETMEALCAPHADTASLGPRTASAVIDATALLDGVADLVLVADAGGGILASSRAARAHFGALAAPGARVEAITPSTDRAFLAEAIRRVLASGIGDRLEIPSAAREGRTLAFALEAAGNGVALFGQNTTTDRDHDRALARERAFGDAMAAAGGTASATIDPRGYIGKANAGLAALTGLPCEALATTRFASLVEPGGRVTLGEAIDGAMAGQATRTVDTILLVSRADPLPVRIGLAPLRDGGTIDGVIAVIAAGRT